MNTPTIKNQSFLNYINFSDAPRIVTWEVTRACDLKCVHCRAFAQKCADPGELTTKEGINLINEIRRFGSPILIFSGGDPLKRQDICTLIAHAKKIGLHPSASPSGTPLLNRENIEKIFKAGAETISISIDAPTPETHDAFRRVPGSFACSVNAARIIQELGGRLQINTVITKYNIKRLDEMADLVENLGAKRWEVFFLVPTGRGRELELPTADEYEKVAHWLYDQTNKRTYRISAIEAPMYRRVVLERLAKEQKCSPLDMLRKTPSGYGRFIPKMGGGNGFIFISHTGEIYPSGFLPLSAGNVRKNSLTEIYRHHSLFTDIRTPEKLKGKCGKCPYKEICGGSRARAYALSNDYLAEDPSCAYTA